MHLFLKSANILREEFFHNYCLNYKKMIKYNKLFLIILFFSFFILQVLSFLINIEENENYNSTFINEINGFDENNNMKKNLKKNVNLTISKLSSNLK